MFEEKDHFTGLYPLSDHLMTGFYVFSSPNQGYVQREKCLPILKEKFRRSGWIGRQVLEEIEPTTLIY